MKFMKLGDRVINVEAIAFIDYEFSIHNLIGIIRFINQDSVSIYKDNEAEFNAILEYIGVKGVSMCDVGNISDGYHTFNELYAHRVRLFSTLMRAYPNKSWWSRKHFTGEQWEGWIIAGIDTPSGPVTYHLPDSEIEHLGGIMELPLGKEWDGHTPADVLERLLTLQGD